MRPYPNLPNIILELEEYKDFTKLEAWQRHALDAAMGALRAIEVGSNKAEHEKLLAASFSIQDAARILYGRVPDERG